MTWGQWRTIRWRYDAETTRRMALKRFPLPFDVWFHDTYQMRWDWR